MKKVSPYQHSFLPFNYFLFTWIKQAYAYCLPHPTTKIKTPQSFSLKFPMKPSSSSAMAIISHSRTSPHINREGTCGRVTSWGKEIEPKNVMNRWRNSYFIDVTFNFCQRRNSVIVFCFLFFFVFFQFFFLFDFGHRGILLLDCWESKRMLECGDLDRKEKGKIYASIYFQPLLYCVFFSWGPSLFQKKMSYMELGTWFFSLFLLCPFGWN